MFVHDDITEYFYDGNDFLFDKDNGGDIWRLVSNVDDPTISKVLHHPAVLAQKSQDTRICQQVRQSVEDVLHAPSTNYIELNKCDFFD